MPLCHHHAAATHLMCQLLSYSWVISEGPKYSQPLPILFASFSHTPVLWLPLSALCWLAIGESSCQPGVWGTACHYQWTLPWSLSILPCKEWVLEQQEVGFMKGIQDTMMENDLSSPPLWLEDPHSAGVKSREDRKAEGSGPRSRWICAGWEDSSPENLLGLVSWGL